MFLRVSVGGVRVTGTALSNKAQIVGYRKQSGSRNDMICRMGIILLAQSPHASTRYSPDEMHSCAPSDS